jgi:hypothetical protein
MLRRRVSQEIKTWLVASATAAALAISHSTAEAAPITFYSGDGGDLVNGLSAVVIDPHPAWGDVSLFAGLPAGTAEWISYANTGMGGIVAPNVTSRNLGHQTATFTRTFDLLAPGSFSLWVLADDTATVRLLGPGGSTQTLFTAFPTQIDPCAPGGTGAGLGCMQADMGVITDLALAAGSYTLEIAAFQTNGWVFGAQYAGTIESVPEPGSLLLLVTGAGFLAARKRLRPLARPADRS